jgi:hypothetical protein
VILTAAKKEAKAMKDAAQKEIARWEAEKKDIYKTRTFEPIIKLNVGGTSFSTTLKTLTSIPGSTLGKMFSGRHELPKDQNGAYFIDRDPLPFAEIITFLRSPTEYHAPVIDVELKAKLLTEAAFFGVKPALVLKGGFIAADAMGDPNASIPTPQPVHYRPMFGAFGGALHRGSLTFVSQASLGAGVANALGLHKTLSAVRACRTVRKSDMVHNAWLPQMDIDPQTYEVRADGALLTCEPASVLPMAQRYFLF